MVNNKPASAYAKPHTMSGKAVKVEANPGSGKDLSDLNNLDISLSQFNRPIDRETKTSGIKMRGTGAATKGVMSRGPMA
jgi:hypothetical protein